MQDFYRIRRLPPYVFEEVNKAKAKARNAGADIIDLGMGNPDLPAPAHVIEKLKDTLGKPRTDRYSASRGIPGLRRAQAAYYERRFGVKLNPDTQIVTTLGSKEGFANVAQAITAPGDVVLVPNPSYPIHAFGFLMAGGAIRSVPSDPTPNFFHTLERAIVHSIPKPTAVVVCYPANPTAYVATLDYGYDFKRMAMDFERGTPLSRERDAKIVADRGWQSSSVWLERGKPYRVTASGRYQIGAEQTPEGVVTAAQRELMEELGFEVDKSQLLPLGPSVFPAAGICAERHFYFHVAVDPNQRRAPLHDGSPLEAFGEVIDVPLSNALAWCTDGSIEDGKTEIGLRRFADIVARSRPSH